MTSRPVEELTAAVRPVLAAVPRLLPAIVAGVAVLITVLAGLSLVGAAVDDSAIDDNRAVASAEVLDGSSYRRTLIRFTVAGGQAVVPERGVFYPRGLQAGETVAVEYDVTHPELVRVAGRSWTDGIGPLVIGLAVLWAVLGPLALWLRQRRRPAPR